MTANNNDYTVCCYGSMIWNFFNWKCITLNTHDKWMLIVFRFVSQQFVVYWIILPSKGIGFLIFSSLNCGPHCEVKQTSKDYYSATYHQRVHV